jgi:hypothetical protein
MANEKDIYVDINPNLLGISSAAQDIITRLNRVYLLSLEASTAALTTNMSFIRKDIP